MKTASEAKAWLFDLDGTLIDTAGDLGHAANLVRQECGLRPLPLSDYRAFASSGARGMLKIGLNIDPDHPDFPPRRDSFLAHYRANLTTHSRLFPGITELLLGLELKGIKWGVVTNKPGWLTQPLMKELTLDSRASCVVSGDTTDNPKPAPDPILHACTQIRLEASECVYIGDDARDIQAARAAGMPSIAAGWGYIGQVPIPDWKADMVAPTVGDLTRLLAT